MALRNTKIHLVPKQPAIVFARKYVARATFTSGAPRCPQCGSTTFTLHGCAISGLRKVYVDGKAAVTTPADVTLSDYELYSPDQLECKRCNTITHFK